MLRCADYSGKYTYVKFKAMWYVYSTCMYGSYRNTTTVKELLKSFHNYQSYPKNKNRTCMFLWFTVYLQSCNKLVTDTIKEYTLVAFKELFVKCLKNIVYSLCQNQYQCSILDIQAFKPSSSICLCFTECCLS